MNSPNGDGAQAAESRMRAVMQTIGAQALRSNLDRVGELSNAVNATFTTPLDAEARQVAVGIAHQLVGSAGTFGHDHVSELARELELLLRHGSCGEQAMEAAQRLITLMHTELLAASVPDVDSD